MVSLPKRLALTLLPDVVLTRLKKIHYVRLLRRISEADEPDLRVLRYLIEPGQSAADIGANIGVYTKYLSERLGGSGRVISVEPVPETFDILRSNVRELGLSNVELRNYAISDTAGQIRMQVPSYEFGGANFYEARVASEKGTAYDHSLVVPATTLDELLSAIDEVHFIKCDVEGHEYNCIRGARKTIERCRPAWLIELSGPISDPESTGCRTVDALRREGYEPYWFDGARLRTLRSVTGSINYFFFIHEHLEVLQRRGLPIAV
jgi:FkbM family methyltransferase